MNLQRSLELVKWLWEEVSAEEARLCQTYEKMVLAEPPEKQLDLWQAYMNKRCRDCENLKLAMLERLDTSATVELHEGRYEEGASSAPVGQEKPTGSCESSNSSL